MGCTQFIQTRFSTQIDERFVETVDSIDPTVFLSPSQGVPQRYAMKSCSVKLLINVSVPVTFSNYYRPYEFIQAHSRDVLH